MVRYQDPVPFGLVKACGPFKEFGCLGCEDQGLFQRPGNPPEIPIYPNPLNPKPYIAYMP